MADTVTHSSVASGVGINCAKESPSSRAKLVWIAVIIGMTCLAYLPAMPGGFIMDDDRLLTTSAVIKAPDGLARIWLTDEAEDYWPITNTSLWLEWRVWGGNPAGYRFTNLALHVASALLIWAILRRLAVPGASLAALLFALHPVNVESIAWVAQRKNALAMLLFLLSIYCYLRQDGRTRTSETMKTDSARFGVWYWLSLLAFLFAMLSKGSVAVLPILLLLIIWWQQGRIGMRNFARTTPFFLIAIALTAVNLWFQTHGAGVAIREASAAQRLAGAGAVVWFYLGKAFLPIQLLFVYPPWRIETQQWLWWLPLLGAVIVSLLLGWPRKSPNSTWRRSVLFAWLFFGISLAPVLGFADVGFMRYSLVADHYAHLATIAVAALAAAAWSVWHDRTQVSIRWAPISAAAAVVACLALLTWRQNQCFGDPIALYEATLEKNPTCWMAHNNLGLALAQAKRFPEAIDHYREAVRLKADFPEALNNWGAALNRIHQPQQAVERLQEALRINPDFPAAHNNLGMALQLTDRWPEAIHEFQLAIEMQPNFAVAHDNLGVALTKIDRTQPAIDQFQQALQLNPDFPEAEFHLAMALEQIGRSPEAIDHFQKAVRLKPYFPEAYSKWGAALSNDGRPQDAIEPLQQALRMNPDLVEARLHLGIALTHVGRTPDGIEQFEQALRLKPDVAEAHLNLGVAYGKVGRVQEAMDQFQRTLQLNPQSIKAYTNLAKACVLLNRPAEAIAAAEQALALARSQGNSTVAGEITAWLESYRTEQAASDSRPRAGGDQPAQRP